VIEVQSNLKAPAGGIVEQGSKHGWRVEVGITQEMDRDRAIHAYEGNRLDIFDCSIVVD
jgi:hypothetical protein